MSSSASTPPDATEAPAVPHASDASDATEAPAVPHASDASDAADAAANSDRADRTYGKAIITGSVAGIVLFDLGAQGVHISNQTRIYALRPDARNRLTTAYMVSYFVGGVVGSLLAAVTYDVWGWGAVCAVGAGAAVAGLAVWGATQRLDRVVSAP